MQVAANFTAGDGLQSTYDWLVLLCSMVGSKFFGLGCAASFILGNNLDYAQQLAAWKAQGKLGSPPRLVSYWERPETLCCMFYETALQHVRKPMGLIHNAVQILNAACIACRYKWVGFHPDSLYWWGGVLYILGW